MINKSIRLLIFTITVTITILLSSCTSSSQPTISATITPRNLGVIILDDIVYSDGDLPSTYDIGQTIILLPDDLKTSVPAPENFIMKKFPDSNFKNDISTITVLLYSNQDDLEIAYKYFIKQAENVKNASIITIDTIGDKSEFTYAYGTGMDSHLNFVSYQKAQLVFQKCNTVVYIQLYSGTASKEEITNYAARMEKRIIQNICQ